MKLKSINNLWIRKISSHVWETNRWGCFEHWILNFYCTWALEQLESPMKLDSIIWVLQDSIAKLWWNGRVFADFQLNIISLLCHAPSKLNLSNSKWEHQWMLHWSFPKTHSLDSKALASKAQVQSFTTYKLTNWITTLVFCSLWLPIVL